MKQIVATCQLCFCKIDTLSYKCSQCPSALCIPCFTDVAKCFQCMEFKTAITCEACDNEIKKTCSVCDRQLCGICYNQHIPCHSCMICNMAIAKVCQRCKKRVCQNCISSQAHCDECRGYYICKACGKGIPRFGPRTTLCVSNTCPNVHGCQCLRAFRVKDGLPCYLHAIVFMCHVCSSLCESPFRMGIIHLPKIHGVECKHPLCWQCYVRVKALIKCISRRVSAPIVELIVQETMRTRLCRSLEPWEK
jgi:hypothetical protein